ncbi:MAG: helix-turn-helix domain-containing protein [Candidatus Aminicenantes bacterium]|nr:helix-turn-helix domain-containing protein [Candidatus Aminicenantes bacterium]NIM78127.1 helix-turn-helix domain-containing protein [Candidatus Aminicenantes bacterium]NIN17445.1 helix-turn-helix domain-containing protein [Candidatus Aminicenantes bacterium]NIN41341.1 helix-turn-helix domain-containing protein [Candidatus Aminicenantes bacterium]NIN84111.1 helix-turn-helix domain-containing protein [Candidatus Aminicenantes bacterium]
MSQKELARAVYRMIYKASPEELGKLTGKEIARRFKTSQSNISRAFRRYYNFTLRRSLELRKFTVFNHLMYTGTTNTVKEALEILDIRSTSHFIKRYKEIFGLTPGKRIRIIRQRHKELKQKWAREMTFS